MELKKKMTVIIDGLHCEVSKSVLDAAQFYVEAPKGYVFPGFMTRAVHVDHLHFNPVEQGTSLYGLSLIRLSAEPEMQL